MSSVFMHEFSSRPLYALECLYDWFHPLFGHSILPFIDHDAAFRSKLISCVKEVYNSDVALWPPLALVVTYYDALNALDHHTSWLDFMVCFFQL